VVWFIVGAALGMCSVGLQAHCAARQVYHPVQGYALATATG
jgi:hypothetical protein